MATPAARCEAAAYFRLAHRVPECVPRERGPEFGVKPDGALARVLADKEPGRLIAGIMEGAERAMRNQLKLAAEREAAQALLKQTLYRGHSGPGFSR